MTDVSPRKVPKQERARATWDAILDAAAQVLVDQGVDKATTNLIAKRAGVSVGSLYQYFPNKNAIIHALWDRHHERMIALLGDSVADLLEAPLPVAVRTYVGTMLEAHAVEPKLHNVLAGEITRLIQAEGLVRLEREAIALVRTYLEAHKDEILPRDLDLAAFVLVNSVEATMHAALLDGTVDVGDGTLADEMTALVCRYLGVEPDA